jgi:hypothetical protein
MVPRLSMALLISAILFENKYTFAMRNKNIYYPSFAKRKTIKSTHTTDTSTSETTKKNTKNTKNKKLSKEFDKYVILCNIKKEGYDVDKYLNNLSRAYSSDNFYPILIYPKQLKILDYTNTKHTIEFTKILEPINNKHGFNLHNDF